MKKDDSFLVDCVKATRWTREFFSRRFGESGRGSSPTLRSREDQLVTIVVEDFHKNYERTVAVAGITFSVEPGEILGLVGPNGAGKTTTLRALAGILRPTRGHLAISGYDLAREPVAAKAVLAVIESASRIWGTPFSS